MNEPLRAEEEEERKGVKEKKTQTNRKDKVHKRRNLNERLKKRGRKMEAKVKKRE